MSRVVVLAGAVADLERGREFYDSQQAGVGDYFIRSLLEDFERLEKFHGIHSRHFGCLRMLSDRFPFGIYYRDTLTETQVLAVLDMRRDPGWLRRELAWRGA